MYKYWVYSEKLKFNKMAKQVSNYAWKFDDFWPVKITFIKQKKRIKVGSVVSTEINLLVEYYWL